MAGVEVEVQGSPHVGEGKRHTLLNRQIYPIQSSRSMSSLIRCALVCILTWLLNYKIIDKGDDEHQYKRYESLIVRSPNFGKQTQKAYH